MVQKTPDPGVRCHPPLSSISHSGHGRYDAQRAGRVGLHFVVALHESHRAVRGEVGGRLSSRYCRTEWPAGVLVYRHGFWRMAIRSLRCTGSGWAVHILARDLHARLLSRRLANVGAAVHRHGSRRTRAMGFTPQRDSATRDADELASSMAACSSRAALATCSILARLRRQYALLFICGHRHPTPGDSIYASFQGLRYSRVSSLLASLSPTMISFAGSHWIFRPVSIAMRPRWPGMAE